MVQSKKLKVLFSTLMLSSSSNSTSTATTTQHDDYDMEGIGNGSNGNSSSMLIDRPTIPDFFKASHKALRNKDKLAREDPLNMTADCYSEMDHSQLSLLFQSSPKKSVQQKLTKSSSGKIRFPNIEVKDGKKFQGTPMFPFVKGP